MSTSIAAVTPPLADVEPDAGEDAPKRQVRHRPKRQGALPVMLLIPTLTIFIVVVGYPVVQLVISSFQEFGRAQIFGAPPTFVGFQNYTTVLTDPHFWAVLGRSLLFCAVNVVATMGLGIGVALLMKRANTFFRTLVSVGLLLAWAMPAITAVVVWGWLFDTSYGLINYVLTELSGVNFVGHSWLLEPLSFFMVATIIITWQSVPLVAFTVYAGLSQVPEEVLEASQLDGAGGVKRFLLIVVPYIRPILIVLTVLQIIWDLRVFTQIYALQGIGGIRDATSTIGVYIFQTSIGTGDFGTGSAIGIILVLIMAALSVFYVRSNLKQEEQ